MINSILGSPSFLLHVFSVGASNKVTGNVNILCDTRKVFRISLTSFIFIPISPHTKGAVHNHSKAARKKTKGIQLKNSYKV